MSKRFDCLKYQRNIRQQFISEAGGDLNQLLKILSQKAEESELIHFFKDRQKQKIKNPIK